MHEINQNAQNDPKGRGSKYPKIRPHGPYGPKKTPDVTDLFKTTVIQILLQTGLDFAKIVLFFLNSIVQLILHTLWLWLHLANFWYDHSSIHFFSHLSNYKDCTDLKVVILRSHFKVYMRKKMVFFLMWKLQFNWSLAVFIFFAKTNALDDRARTSECLELIVENSLLQSAVWVPPMLEVSTPATGKYLMWVCHWDDNWKNLTPVHSRPSIWTEKNKNHYKIKRNSSKNLIRINSTWIHWDKSHYKIISQLWLTKMEFCAERPKSAMIFFF